LTVNWVYNTYVMKNIFRGGRGLGLNVSVMLCVILTGCKKLVQVSPPTTSLTSDNVYTTDATAASVLTGIYTNMASPSPTTGTDITCLSLAGGLAADELILYGGSSNANSTLAEYYYNQLTTGLSASLNAGTNQLWAGIYGQIYVLNIALERLSASTGLTSAVQLQLIGEAKFMRAFFYFYLVNLYGDVPLAVSSDYTINANLARTPKSEVYLQIIADLKSAASLLSNGYVGADAVSATPERVRPNKWAAMALLARTYLYTQDYPDAEVEADSVIVASSLYQLDSLNGVFLKNSSEAIWQLQPVNTGWNTEDARIFILPATGPSTTAPTYGYPVYLSAQLMGSFEAGDARRTNWVDSVLVGGISYYFSYKYKSATLNAAVTEYSMVLRLGEQYLIRAEARAQHNNLLGAASDLNAIRRRAGLGATSAADQPSMLAAIWHERQVELFTEWGHRWLDLKRSGMIDPVMTAVSSAKGRTWKTDWQYWPIPEYDIAQDPNLTQNPGY
jgi:hypothetical protein